MKAPLRKRKRARKILLADDDTPLRTLLQITLGTADYQVLESADGLSALRAARSERPDLIILDWMMPGMTGLEVAETLRRDTLTQSIPIIMLTARDEVEDERRARALGIYGFMVKPFSPLEFLNMVEAALGE